MPKLAITAKIGRRIRTLAGKGKSHRQIVAVVEAESGTRLDHRTVARYLEKHGPLEEAPAPPPAPPAPPPPPPPAGDDDDVDELVELRDNLRRLRLAMDAVEPDKLAALTAERRKTLAAIRAAKSAGRGDTSAADRAAALRERLRGFLPPSAPTHAEQQSAGPPLPDEPGAARCG